MGRGRKHKRKKPSHQYHHLYNVHTTFPLMLAALANLDTPSAKSLLQKCLKKLHLSLLVKTPRIFNPSVVFPETLANPFISLLPILLRSKCPAIASRSAEIVGAIALLSFEMNERLASDVEIMNGLMTSLSSWKKRVSMAACNAILDLSTTLAGRQRLCEFSAVDKLMSVFLQVADCPAKSVSLCRMENGSSNNAKIGFMVYGLPVLLLDAAVTLINMCDLDNLTKIPRKLSETFLSHLKELWAKARSQMLLSSAADCSQERCYEFSNVRMHDLAETIFRLSIDLGQCPTTFSFEVVMRSMFGPTDSDFEHFMLNYWEDSPFLFKRPSKGLNDQDNIFCSFLRSLNSKGTVDSILSSILCNLVSCPPIASDELDIIRFLKEVKDGFGCPIYGQDIRVLKTVETTYGSNQEHLKREVHFFRDSTDSCIKGPHSIDIVNVRKFEEAYKQGYTIALRGMEFRSENVGTIADELAVMFGQPSVGANLYLTPPRSQGLARHYDDHCVFVCQLLGVKQWTVFSRLTVLLPRLYEPLDSLLGSEGESNASDCKHFLLREGDILYIPRGCPHEACTITDDSGHIADDCSAGSSLHLTLGIEVEPPFEWEGFAHVALHCWNQNQSKNLCTVGDSLLGVLNVMSVYLLHIAIKLIGDCNPTFRKACLVAAFSLPSDTIGKQWLHTLDLTQRNTFNYVIKTIDRESEFLEVFKSVEAVVQKNEDPFQQMRWIQHLYQEGVTTEELDWGDPLMRFKDFFLLCNGHREESESAFAQVKSIFCRDVVYEDTCENFKILLDKYKKTRKQYMNGMLSLHYT